MAKLFSRRVLRGSRLLEFAAGEYHKKYVPESPFYTNPLLTQARTAALKKTEGGYKLTYHNVTAEAQGALDTIRKVHAAERNRVVSEASPLAKMALIHQKHDIPMSGPDMEQALNLHQSKLRDLKAKHQEQESRIVEAHGGKVFARYVPPGQRLVGKKLEPTLHPSWVNYAVRINERGMHTEHLARQEAMKEARETVPTPGKETEGGPEKGIQSKLSAEQTRYRREILSNKTPWKGYRSELLGKRTKARQAMAEELGYRITPRKAVPGVKPGIRIEVTGKRQIIQAQRKLRGSLPAPLSTEEIADIRSNRPPTPGATIQGPRPHVGLAGASPEQIGEYSGEMKRVESNLSRLTGEEITRRTGEAVKLKAGLQKKADISIASWHPGIDPKEAMSRRDVAVNRLLHGTVDPRRATNIDIEGEELAQHAGTIGISVKHAKKMRSQYRNLADTEKSTKNIRSKILATGAPFLETGQAAGSIGPKYPHLKKLGIGLGIGAGVLGGAYLAHRLLRKRNGEREEQEARMASRLKLIHFAERERRRGDQRAILSKVRYIKSIKNQDIANAVANYGKAAGVGAGLGFLLKGKMPVGRALKIGAVGGIGTEAVTRALTAGSKDPYGERSWQGKYVDQAPAVIGAATAGGILTKRHLPKAWKAVTQFQIKKQPDDEPPAWHDIATGGIEGGVGVLATDRLIKKFAPEGSAVGKKLVIGAGVGGLATGAIGYGLNKLVRKKIAERRQKKLNQLSSRLRLIQFALSDEEREEHRQARRWGERGLKARGEEIYTWGGRGLRTARDIKNTIAGRPDVDSRGRPRKKEWQKPWFYKKLALTGIGLGLGGYGVVKTGIGRNIVHGISESPVGKFYSGVQSDLKALRKSAAPPTAAEAVKASKLKQAESEAQKKQQRGQVKDILGMKSKVQPIQFYARTLDYWDARDLSPNQAVVTAPGGQRRYRRKKKFGETKTGRDILWGGGLASALGLGYAAYRWKKPPAEGGGGPVHEQLPLPLLEKKAEESAVRWTPTGHLIPKIKLSFRGPVIRFDEKRRNYTAPAIGTATGIGGFVAGGMYRGRKLQPGEDLTGRRITRPHSVFPLLQHEGIGTGSGKIAQIHYTPSMGEEGVVQEVSQEEFAKGKTIKALDTKISEEAAKRARAGVGKKVPYSLFYNNCQRFGGCARMGRTRFVPRQLRTALTVGGLTGVGGYGATRLIQSRRKEFSSIQFKEGDHTALRRTAILGGLGVAGLGVGTFPGARKMMAIAGRDILEGARGKLATTKGLRSIFKPPTTDPNKGGRMVYDYIDASQRFLNRGLAGKVAGGILRAGVAKPESFVGRVSNAMYPGDFGPGHFARFRAGHLQALGHWDYEYGKMLEHKLAPKIHPTTGRVTPIRESGRRLYEDLQTRVHYGREKAHAEIHDALYNKGMNEQEALHHVATKSTDPQVHDYFNLLAGSKEKAGKKYAKLSLISPGLIAGGTGTAAIAHGLRPKKDKK